ncbi:hypothetical protein ACJ73_02414 [Blastomyces percursus]|uniref:Integrase zinc-binding domain-containing protein n=1 Tax=Blastomyces percursus TaxID=1658174 RepID=A0A1J9RCH7_9EURO|nr:hypothetical protein ACJ73_02414 [Blastomyces percursus]
MSGGRRRYSRGRFLSREPEPEATDSRRDETGTSDVTEGELEDNRFTMMAPTMAPTTDPTTEQFKLPTFKKVEPQKLYPIDVHKLTRTNCRSWKTQLLADTAWSASIALAKIYLKKVIYEEDVQSVHDFRDAGKIWGFLMDKYERRTAVDMVIAIQNLTLWKKPSMTIEASLQQLESLHSELMDVSNGRIVFDGMVILVLFLNGLLKEYDSIKFSIMGNDNLTRANVLSRLQHQEQMQATDGPASTDNVIGRLTDRWISSSNTNCLIKQQQNCIILIKLYAIKIPVTLKSLVDSGANGYLFISWKLAEQVVKRFGIQVVKLDTAVDVIGFDQRPSSLCWKQDLIIGRKFLEQHDIWLDVRNQEMVWPEDRMPSLTPPDWTPTGSAREIKILRRELTVPEVKPEHQEDALSRREDVVKAQRVARDDFRQQVLLPKENLDPTILEELNSIPQVAVMAIDEGLGLMGKLITRNKERLVVPETEDHIRTQLIKEVHDQISTAHPGRTKTRKLLTSRYYWKGMGKDILTFHLQSRFIMCSPQIDSAKPQMTPCLFRSKNHHQHSMWMASKNGRLKRYWLYGRTEESSNTKPNGLDMMMTLPGITLLISRTVHSSYKAFTTPIPENQGRQKTWTIGWNVGRRIYRQKIVWMTILKLEDKLP